MHKVLPSGLAGFAAAPDRAASFVERGVAIPFTAPPLLGARARATPQGVLEFLISNPSGGRGLYVLPWEALAPLTTPSLQDTLLWRALRLAGPPTPRLVRGLSLRLLQGGAAGPAAQAAAGAALAADAAAQDAARSALLTRLTLGTEPAGSQPPLAEDTPGGRERRAGRALWALGLSQGEEANVMAGRLNELAVLSAPLAANGSVARDLAALGRLVQRLRAAAGDPRDPLAGAVIARAEEAMRLAEAARAALATMLEQPWVVLAGWAGRLAGVAEAALRPDWLLDGWAHLAALQAVMPAERPVLMPMLAPLVPAWPMEAAAWSSGWGLGGRVAPPLPRQPAKQRRALGPEPQALLEAMLAEAA